MRKLGIDSAAYKIKVIFGTRPEAVKLVPVIKALKSDSAFDVSVLVTAQHRQMLDQMLSLYGLAADHDLDIMTDNQVIVDVTSKCLSGVDSILKADRPDMIIVQGDTTTAFASALAAFYNKIAVGHVEAGLRTRDRFSPFPEEINRRLVGVLADLHFAPTKQAADNLLNDGVPPESIKITGNTVVDALMHISEQPYDIDQCYPDLAAFIKEHPRFILVTAHRRESFGEPFEDMCRAMRGIVDQHDDTAIIYPVHPNPNVRETVDSILRGHPSIFLAEPLDYLCFVHLMKRSYLLLTDSGGVQEEGPTFSKPVLVMRDNTERPEGVEAGVAQLVGTSYKKITETVVRLLADRQAYDNMALGVNPFGDGRASERIVVAMHEYLDACKS
ncbi:MAG: UDP-N-acetylglucosamine 2-epimerase (non-hydrolyzing) [Dissulfurispiraceae bacterium]|jgi:UDP-N-acetylglucosamine 2-epimerase (non-hydrolysing)|nr:UDP-N-acetylglucosamine 2-epimerase (non-hydrolyzing) [Dissulfurispiraceae bacterium]